MVEGGVVSLEAIVQYVELSSSPFDPFAPPQKWFGSWLIQ